jgi:CBS domain-containing protein
LVDEYTTPAPVTASRYTPLARIMDLMSDLRIRHVPIEEDGRLIGIVSDRNVREVARSSDLDDLVAEDVMIANPITVETGTALETVALAMAETKIGSVIVCEHGRIQGIFTAIDAMNALVELARGDVAA